MFSQPPAKPSRKREMESHLGANLEELGVHVSERTQKDALLCLAPGVWHSDPRKGLDTIKNYTRQTPAAPTWCHFSLPSFSVPAGSSRLWRMPWSPQGTEASESWCSSFSPSFVTYETVPTDEDACRRKGTTSRQPHGLRFWKPGRGQGTCGVGGEMHQEAFW